MQAVWNSNGFFLFMWVQMWFFNSHSLLQFIHKVFLTQALNATQPLCCWINNNSSIFNHLHPPSPQKERRPKIQVLSLQPMCRIEKSSSSCPVWPVCCVHSADVRGLIGCRWWNLWRLCDLKDDGKRWIYHVGSWVGGCFWVVGNTQGHQKIREWSLNLRKSYSPFFV